jgi:Flp pilus assembly protein TadD
MKPRINLSLRLTLYCQISWGPNEATMTRSLCSKLFTVTRRPAPALLAAALALAVAGCQTTQPMEVTGSLGAAAPQATTDWKRSADAWGERYRFNPNDPQVAINYATALRGNGQRSQAVAVLEQASIAHPRNMDVLGAYGRALADVGNYKQALDVLGRAHTPDQPDWRILSVQGAVLDQMGRHPDAQRYYASALKIVPDEPSVMSNLGLSYALSKDLPKAETTLRRAVERPGADPRVRQNLALVVGLQGRFPEAETIARADLPPEQAAANVAYLKQMMSDHNDWAQAGPAKSTDRPGDKPNKAASRKRPAEARAAAAVN